MADISEVIRRIGYEANPTNDYNADSALSVTFKRLGPLYDGSEDRLDYILRVMGSSLHNQLQLFKGVKSYVRGGVIGGIAGAMVAAATGRNMQETVASGMSIGADVDFTVFLLKFFYYYIKAQRPETQKTEE
jgi:hypothetical protein